MGSGAPRLGTFRRFEIPAPPAAITFVRLEVSFSGRDAVVFPTGFWIPARGRGRRCRPWNARSTEDDRRRAGRLSCPSRGTSQPSFPTIPRHPKCCEENVPGAVLAITPKRLGSLCFFMVHPRYPGSGREGNVQSLPSCSCRHQGTAGAVPVGRFRQSSGDRNRLSSRPPMRLLPEFSDRGGIYVIREPCPPGNRMTVTADAVRSRDGSNPAPAGEEER